MFLAANVPETFKNYLVAEEEQKRQDDYASTLENIEIVKAAIAETSQELSSLGQRAAERNATYLALTAKISALEIELNRQATLLATTIASSESQDGQPQQTESELQTMQRVQLEAQIKALELELDQTMYGDGASGLAYMIATGATSGQAYTTAQNLVDKITLALVQARNELATLQGINNSVTVQTAFEKTSLALAEARVELSNLEDTLFSSAMSGDLDYQVAKAKDYNLNEELSSLTGKLSSLLAYNVSSAEITGYLVSGNPSMPIPVFPEKMKIKNALMLGAIIGVALAWVVLNFKWLRKILSSPPAVTEEERN
jgi:hypothetical protein